MFFLHKLRGMSKKATIALFITLCLAIAVSAQKVGGQSEEGKKYGQSGFVGEPINLNVSNGDVRDILSFITEQYDINFVIDKSVKQVPVTVRLNDVPWNLALDSILRSQGLAIDANGPILRVAEAKLLVDEQEINRQIERAKNNNSPLNTVFLQLNYSRAVGNLSGASGGTDSFKGGAVSGGDSSASSSASSGASPSGSSGGSGIMQIIRKRLSSRGSVESDERSNTLIITDVRENIDAIVSLVKLLDQPEPQVEIEARIVIASRNFSRDLGVQLSALALNPSRGGSIGIATAPGSPASGSGGGTNTIGFRPGGVPQGILNPTSALGANLPSTVIGLTTGIFGTAQISMLITAAEQKGQAKVVSTPRVTTLNNRSAQIESGQQIPVVTQQTGGTGGALVFTTTFVSVPLRLSVTPQITNAGTVILRVTAENNSVNTAIAVNGTPGIDTQRMQTEVLVPDGGTTVVGGALLDSETELRNRTPGLGSIPVVGNLFKRRSTSRTTNEILFFITPRIYRSDYNGNPIPSTPTTELKPTVLVQPVPLGNPGSNSTDTTTNPARLPDTAQLPLAASVPQANPKP